MPFAERGFTVAGCDLDGAYLDRGRKAGLTLEEGPAFSLRQHGFADLVLASHVLEHVKYPRAELAAWRELLKPNGLLYVELPGVMNAYEHYGGLGRFLQNAHLWHFTRATLSALAGTAGFTAA